MKNNKEALEKWDRIIRLAAVSIGASFFWVSINFSVNGFNVLEPGMAWVGWVMGIGVTVVQLMWNKMKMKTNLTIAAAGIAAYVYSIGTNIIGILASRHLNLGFGIVTDPSWELAAGGALVFAIAWGIFLDIVPEPMIIWGLFGSIAEGDFIGNLLGQPFIPAEKPEQKPFQKPNIPGVTTPTRYPIPPSVPAGMTAEQRARYEQFKRLHPGDGGGQ